MPMPRRPRVASPDEVKITRDGDYAIIAYADDSIATTNLKMGRERLATMTDADLLAFWNESLEAREAHRREQEYVAIEIPPGKPQVEFFAAGKQWTPRGHVLRCTVMGSTGDPEEPFVTIDGRDYTPMEFARMVGTFGGWGMRIAFVPEDELHEQPEIEVREPGPDER